MRAKFGACYKKFFYFPVVRNFTEILGRYKEFCPDFYGVPYGFLLYRLTDCYLYDSFHIKTLEIVNERDN